MKRGSESEKHGTKQNTNLTWLCINKYLPELNSNNIKETLLKDTVALKMLYFLKIKIFKSLDNCQFVEYLFKIKNIYFSIFKNKKGR